MPTYLASVDQPRFAALLAELAQFSEAPAPAVTRVLFSHEDLAARAWLRQHCSDAGLSLREDAVGNLFARWPGSEPDLPPVATGSHMDAIPNAGMYDGTLGVLGPLEAFRILRATGCTPRRSLELILFTAEEPTRFGIGCLGSRLLSGGIAPAAADLLADSEGRTLRQWRASAGHTAPLETVRLPSGSYSAFIELHIEQGPILERENLDIGIVERIAAPASFQVNLTGEGGHAGAVLMPGRRDALLGAAEIALAVEHAALQSGSPDTVGTTGVLRVLPGAVNSVPCHAHLEVDFRGTDLLARDIALQWLRHQAEEIASRRNLDLEWIQVNQDAPALSAPALLRLAAAQADAEGLRARPMTSRAYHDTLFMARVCPVAMIFVPCRNGWSHRPDEFCSPAHMAAGIAVLAGVLRAASEA